MVGRLLTQAGARGAAWLALGLLVALAGCGGKSTDIQADVQEIVADIPKIVADSARAESVRAAYRHFGDVLVKSAADRRALAARFRTLYRSYDTPRAELEQLIAQIDEQSRRVRTEAVATREVIRAQTTEKEWQALASSRKRLGKLYLKGTP